jgi:hypothetical protein
MRTAKIFFLFFMISMAAFSGCTASVQNSPANTPDINPDAEAANKATAEVTLYFSYRGEELLAGETRQINVPVNDKTEAAVIRELIAGPSTGRDKLTGLFWGTVKLVSVDSTADILFVTLSNDFVSASPVKSSLESGSFATQKKLAILSIVNTIVEMGNYSRVQIQVDREGSKIGERITENEAGWSSDSSNYLEPLGWAGDIVLTPEKTLQEALTSFQNKDWTRLYDFTAYNSPDGTVKPDKAAFSDALSTQGNILESYSATGTNVSYNGQTAVVMLDYSINTRSGDTISKTGIPVVMVRENDIWALSYTSLVNVLVNAG